MKDELPFVRVTPDTIEQGLQKVLEMPRGELLALARKSRAFVEKWHDPIKIAKLIKSDIYKCLYASDFIITSSGTVTLQIAMVEKPMLIMYITSWLTYFLAKRLVKIDYVGLANIIAGRNIVPEFIQNDANADNLSRKTLEIISSEDKMNRMKEELRGVKNSLGSPGASKRAAEIINNFLKQPQL